MISWKKLLGLGSDTKTQERIFVDRAPRLRLTPLQKISFRAVNSKLETSIFNISETGIGLDRRNLNMGENSKDALIAGEIRFDGTVVTVTLKVHRVGDVVVGCSFEGGKKELGLQLRRFLDFELQALKMTRIRDDVLKDGGANQIWFTDGRSNELFLQKVGGEIAHFHMVYFGRYVEGGRGTLTRFGTVVADEKELSSPLYKASESIVFSELVDANDVSTALRFISGIQGLDPAHRNELEAFINSGAR